MSFTKVVKAGPHNPDEKLLQEAADILKSGGLVIIPTETVYGIAVNSLNAQAVQRLYDIKGRPQGKPFSLHIAAKEKVDDLAKEIPLAAYKLMDKFWPGPLTLVLRSRLDGGKTIGIRMPDNEIALRVIGLADIPVACPSANLSGKPAPKNFQEAIKDLQGLVDFAIDAGDTKIGIESSVADFSVEPWRLLREGAIKKEGIEAAIAKKAVLFVCTGNSCRSVMAKGYLEKKLKDKGRLDIEVLSGGVAAPAGMPATLETREVLKKEAVDVSGHRARGITRAMINKSDIILAMEKAQEDRILQIAPEAKRRLFLLKEFAKINGNNLDIADPIGRPMDFYEVTFKTIKEAIDRIAEII